MDGLRAETLVRKRAAVRRRVGNMVKGEPDGNE
jgi:hypothetical protein